MRRKYSDHRSDHRYCGAGFCIDSASDRVVFRRQRGYGTAKLTVVGANEAGGLEGASVLLLDADGETIATAETDSAGNAEFSEVPVGEYTVVCEADGYNARETELAVVISQGNAEDESSGAGDPEEDSDGSPARQIIAATEI